MICIAWDGLASYSEAAIRKFIETTSEEVAIVAILPVVPKTTADVIAGVKINWIKRDYAGTLAEAAGRMPAALQSVYAGSARGWRQGHRNARQPVRMELEAHSVDCAV